MFPRSPLRLLARALPLSIAALSLACSDDAMPPLAPALPRGASASVGPAVIVTNTDDAGPGSLRQAIADAADGATIQFDAAIAGQTIVLTTALVIDKPLIIEGSFTKGMTISGGATTRVFEVGDNGDVTFRNLSIVNGRADYADGDARGASSMLEDSLRVLLGDAAKPPPSMAMPFVTAAEWRLAAGDARGADSLASLARQAGAVDSLALERNAYVGRAELVRARARAALGDVGGARLAASRAVVATSNGYGADSKWTREARALRDSLAR